MAQRQGRGVGSNQYQDRVVAISEEERKAAREGVGKMNVSLDNPSAVASRYGNGGISVATREHRSALDDHLSFSLNAPEGMSRSEIAARQMAGVQRVSAAEDDILSRHPNLYGHALTEANKFASRVNHDPALRKAIANGDPEANRVADACARLLSDAEEPSLDVEGISQAISDMEGGGEWSAIGTADSRPQTHMESEDDRLCRRAAALSAVFSRSSDPSEREDLRHDMDKTQESLTHLRLEALGY